jgi:hypothetical protein
LYPGATGTFTLNSLSVKDIVSNGSVQTLDVVSPTLTTDSITLSSGVFKLNNCTISLRSFATFSISGTGTIDAGTSTINLGGSTTLSASTADFYNVNVMAGAPSSAAISARYIQNLTNTVQPTTVNFTSNIIFGNFGLNGTAGNLVTVTASAVRTLTKNSPWTLGNSVNSGDNTGLDFLLIGSGNNNYLNVRRINGVFILPAVAARLFSTGTLAIANTMQFDEIAQSTASIQQTVVYSSLFDEVSQSAVAMRILSNGSIQVSNIIDEVTGLA